MNKGKLYLIPCLISADTENSVIPQNVINIISKTNIFITENIRTCRRYIKKIHANKNIDDITFYSYGKYNNLDFTKDFLKHILLGENVGLISEAGVPCIADPGSKIVDRGMKRPGMGVPYVSPYAVNHG